MTTELDQRRRSARGLRAELVARSLHGQKVDSAEVGYSRTPGVVYAADAKGGHGNFLHASYRRIVAHPEWARRLEKTYTGSRLLPRAGDRWRGELECATSSDALLMNVFCYPGVLRRSGVCALLGVETGLQPRFGVRAALPMHGGEVDRTELDMCLGTTVAEAKLTEGGFGKASRERLLRYGGVEDIFDLAALPRYRATKQAGTTAALTPMATASTATAPTAATQGAFAGYQLIRGLLAALAVDGSFLVLMDSRRADLQELCFRVLGAVHAAEVRHRLRLRTWQELAGVLPPVLQAFLAEKYGIFPG